MAVTSSSSSSSSVSRVAIVGAGPGGLALANALRTLNTGVKDIYVYDGRADISSTAVGGGVQLSGGAKVLEHLHLLPEIEAVAERLTRVRGRNVRRETLLDIDLNQACLQSKEREALLSREGKNPLLFSIMRSSLQEILLKAAKNPMSGSSSSSASIKIIPNTNIAAIAKASNQKYSLTLKDGSLAASDFDMVFGCDGVNSIVRDFIQAGGKYASSSSSSFSPSFLEKRSYSPGYSGLRVGYVLTKVDKKFALRPEGRGAFHQWFGDGIYALEASYGSLEGPIHMLAIVFKDDADAALGENPEWVTTSLLEQFQRRLARGGLNKVAEIQTLMAAADGNRCIEIGVRESLFPLPTWSSKDGRVLLMGDAAHAMAPFLGQGVNQALQDAYVIAMGIKEVNTVESSRVDAALASLAAKYERIRKPPTTLLRLKSNFLGNLETAGGPLAPLKEAFFRFSSFSGIATKVFISAATPKIK